MSTLDFTVDADGIAHITFDLPGRSVNIFTPELVDDLANAIEQVIGRDDIKGAVLTSAKAVFIAGADLNALLDAHEAGHDAARAAHRFDRENALLRRIETGGKPFVAALNGPALGGGLELALACHHRVLVDEPKAVVGLPEVTVGLLPGGGGTQRLPRLIGIEKALPLLLEGILVKPRQALELGIVDQLAPPAELSAAACAWIRNHPAPAQPWDVKGFSLPGGSGPLAPHAGRSFGANLVLTRKRTQDNYPAPLAILGAVYEGTQLPFDLALRVEAKHFGKLIADPVSRNLIRTLFVNKGRADKLVRRPSGPARLRVSKLGVLGAGMMGAGIARVAAAAGIEVILLDSSLDAAVRGKQRIADALARETSRGGGQDAADALLARIHPVDAYDQLKGCELVIEAVFEDRAVKEKVIRQAQAHLAEDAIVASNTSTLPIGSLAAASPRPANMIGIHFFSPVERMPLVEIIVGPQTSETTLAHALDFIGQLRKTPIVVNDSPGFFTSRIFCSYIDEGMAMLAEGISPALIENAARMMGMATGPLAVTDEVSLDLQLRVINQAVADRLAPQRLRQHAQSVIVRMNELGRFGRKARAGFYDYPASGRKRLSPALREHYAVSARQPDVKEVADRLLYIQAIESARCIEEGVVADPADADLGALLGLGFPAWTGGPLSHVDTVGVPAFVERCGQLSKYGARFTPSAWLIERAACGKHFY